VVYVPTGTKGHEAEEHVPEGCETRGRGSAGIEWQYYQCPRFQMACIIKT
jgi:hypothetical protein